MDNEQEKNDNNSEKNEEQKKYKGKHINKKYLMVLAFIVIFFIVYKIFIPSMPKIDPEPKKIKPVQTEKPSDAKIDIGVSDNYGDKKNKKIKDNKKIIKLEKTQDIDIQTSEKTQIDELAQLKKQLMLQKQQRYFQDKEKAQFASVTFNNNKNNSSNTRAEYEQNNNSDNRNKGFLDNAKQNNIYNNNQLIKPKSPYQIMAGDFLPAVILTAMNSDLPTKTITAQISQNIYDTITGNYLLVPQGTKILGLYDNNILWGQERLLIVWQRLIFPNGDSISLDNMQGVDLTGQAGLSGEVNNHFASLLKGVVLSSVLGGASGIVNSNSDKNNNWQNEAGKGGGAVIVEVGSKFAERALSRPPTITVKQGERLNIMVNSDIILKPYRG